MEPFLWAKAFDFSWTTIKKILSLVFKILIIIGLPALALWLVYVGTVKPHTNPTSTTTVQSGGVKNEYNIKVGLGGCVRMPTSKEKK